MGVSWKGIWATRCSPRGEGQTWVLRGDELLQQLRLLLATRGHPSRLGSDPARRGAGSLRNPEHWGTGWSLQSMEVMVMGTPHLGCIEE
jgi:hypothetical protein